MRQTAVIFLIVFICCPGFVFSSPYTSWGPVLPVAPPREEAADYFPEEEVPDLPEEEFEEPEILPQPVVEFA